MTHPSSCTLLTDSGVDWESDCVPELESDFVVEKEMLGGRLADPGREPRANRVTQVSCKSTSHTWREERIATSTA